MLVLLRYLDNRLVAGFVTPHRYSESFSASIEPVHDQETEGFAGAKNYKGSLWPRQRENIQKTTNHQHPHRHRGYPSIESFHTTQSLPQETTTNMVSKVFLAALLLAPSALALVAGAGTASQLAPLDDRGPEYVSFWFTLTPERGS